MARSISNRNFWGGFWGGVLGIFATATLGFLALMAGCLVGLMLGFYYQELGELAVESWRGVLRRVFSLPVGPTWRERWALLHPYDRARKLKVSSFQAASFAGIAIEATVYVSGYVHVKPGAEIMLGVIAALSILVGYVIRFASYGDSPQWANRSDMRNYYRIQELNARWGDGLFVLREFVLAFMSILFVPAALVAFVLALPIFAVLILTAVVVALPVLFLIAFMRGVYHLATRPDHWSCLVVTVVITTCVATAGYPFLEGPGLLVGALTAGLLSGLGAVQAHSVLSRFFARQPSMAKFMGHTVTEYQEMFLEVMRALIVPRRYQVRVRDIFIAAAR